MLETLDHTIRIGSTPTFLYFDLYLYSAYAAHYVYNTLPIDSTWCLKVIQYIHNFSFIAFRNIDRQFLRLKFGIFSLFKKL